jgi:hypothetical protein
MAFTAASNIPVCPTYITNDGNSDVKIVIGRNKTNHVGGCEIAHDEFEFAGLDDLSDLVCDTLRAHFWLFVIRRYLIVR